MRKHWIGGRGSVSAPHKREHSEMLTQLPRSVHCPKVYLACGLISLPPTSGRVIVPSEIAIVGAVSPGLRESISCVDPQVLRTPFACDTRRREAEHLVLPRPFGGRVHEASHSHSARQPAFDRSLDEIGGEECE